MHQPAAAVEQEMPPAAAADEAFPPGAEVEIGGLSQRPAFNGCRAVVRSYDPESGCYIVALRSEAGAQGAKVMRGNLAPVAEAAGAPRVRSAQRLRCRVAASREAASDRIEGGGEVEPEGSEGAADEPLVGEAEQRVQAAERRAREGEQRALAAEQRAHEVEQRARGDEAALRAQIARLESENDQVQRQARAAEKAFEVQLGLLEVEKQQLQRQAGAAAREEDARLSALESDRRQFRQEAKELFRVVEDSLKSQLRGLELNRERLQQHLAVSAQAEEADRDVHEGQLSALESEKEQFRQEAKVIFQVMEDSLKSQLRGLELDRERLQQQLAASDQGREADEGMSDARPSALGAVEEAQKRQLVGRGPGKPGLELAALAPQCADEMRPQGEAELNELTMRSQREAELNELTAHAEELRWAAEAH